MIIIVCMFIYVRSTFIGNDGGRGGVVSTSYLPLRFDGNNTLARNTGTGLTVSDYHATVVLLSLCGAVSLVFGRFKCSQFLFFIAYSACPLYTSYLIQ